MLELEHRVLGLLLSLLLRGLLLVLLEHLLRGLGHHGRVSARDLHGLGGDLAIVVDASRGLLCGPEQCIRGGHFAYRIACAQSFAQLPIGPVGHTGHRRNDQWKLGLV